MRKMVSIGFLNKDNAPTPEAAQFLPNDLECPSSQQLERTVVFFHDESVFTANEDQKLQWGRLWWPRGVTRQGGCGTMPLWRPPKQKRRPHVRKLAAACLESWRPPV